MRPRLVVILLFIVLVPLVVMIWLGVRTVRDERRRTAERFEQILSGRLQDVSSGISRVAEGWERELIGLLESPAFSAVDSGILRSLARRSRLARQVFLLDADGDLLYPREDADLSGSERSFIERTSSIWESGETFYRPSEMRGRQELPREAHGWYRWYWGTGVSFIFWARDDSGRIRGVELARAAMMSDVVAAMPVSVGGIEVLREARIVLRDGGGAGIYQWGEYRPSDNEQPVVELDVGRPLDAWSLEYFISAEAYLPMVGRGAIMGMISGLIALAAVLVVMALYFYSESTRDMREAEQRVSFVNQVSHELKTPLTNIRLYAELLEQSAPADDQKMLERVAVVVSESQRLSRLITNVLTFAKKRKDGLHLHLARRIVDEVIQVVVTNFRPVLQSKGVEIQSDGNASAEVFLDCDMVGQILGNLLSNVEKYAASGGRVTISSLQEGDTTTVLVTDMGPGIDPGQADVIFDPFTRLSNKLTDGVSGAGIGLAISRDLARLHGGDLELVPSGQGACFMLTLTTEPVIDGAEAGR